MENKDNKELKNVLKELEMEDSTQEDIGLVMALSPIVANMLYAAMGEDGLKELIVSIYSHRIIRPDAAVFRPEFRNDLKHDTPPPLR